MIETTTRRAFKAIYRPGTENTGWARLRPKVIGLYGRFAGMVEAPPQRTDYFIYFAHEPVLVPTAGDVIRLPAQALFIVPPDMPVRHGKEHGYWRRSWLRCRGWAVADILRDCGVPAARPLPVPSPALHEHYLRALHREMNHPRGPEAANIEDLFRLWLRHVRREALPTSGPPIPDRFLRARNFIEENFLEGLTLDRIAAEIHLSRSQLCRGFRQYFELSPIDYALHLRLEYAAELLDNVNLNITEVALESGFRDVFYFSRCFKKHMEVSPSAYRKARTRDR